MEVNMKKKLSILIVSCFLLSAPSFAAGPHQIHHKKPHPPKPPLKIEKIHHHHIENVHHHCCNNSNNYYDNYSYTTAEDVEIAKIQGLTDIIISILN